MTTHQNDEYERTPNGCRFGPSRCMDDLCRNSPIGLCGLTDEDFVDYEGDDWELYIVDDDDDGDGADDDLVAHNPQEQTR